MLAGKVVEYAITTKGLAKHYGDTKALDGIDLQIPKGTVYGVLGPNGAGKTTTIRILTTLAKSTGGTATVLGFDVATQTTEVRKHIGLTGQAASVDEELTGRENLVMVGRLLGLSWKEAKVRSKNLLETFGLQDAGKRLVRTYSGGMRRRIDIAASLVCRPEILFLDEPTTGLDPRSRNQVWEMIQQVKASGTTVVLTTQYLEEADKLADRLAVIDQGKIIAEGTSKELKAKVGANALTVELQESERETAAKIVEEFLDDWELPESDEDTLTIKLKNPAQALPLLEALGKKVKIDEFSLGNPSLDDVFFALTGKPAESP